MNPVNLATETERVITRINRSSRRFDVDVMGHSIVQDILFQWGENAESLEQAALLLESTPEESGTLAGIKRTLHAIKGDAGVCGLTEVNEAFHDIESLLERYLARDVCPTDLILKVTDWLRNFLDGIRTDNVKPFEHELQSANKKQQKVKKRFQMKMLIAEDDVTSRAMLQAVLTKWGYDVTATSDGEQAWAALQEPNAPGLAVLDWEMPGLNGAELCRRLREQARKEPLYLILLTSRSESGDIVRGLEAGADDYIAKPYDNAELKARVDVGRRMLLLQNEMREREKLQGVLEMAGAVCHELNQPLQIVSGFSEMLLLETDAGDKNYETLKTIKQGIARIGELTRRIMKITRYHAKPYLKGRIVDINEASE